MITTGLIKAFKSNSRYAVILQESGNGLAWNISEAKSIVNYKDVAVGVGSTETVIGINNSGKIVPIIDNNNTFSQIITTTGAWETTRSRCTDYTEDQRRNFEKTPEYFLCRRQNPGWTRPYGCIEKTAGIGTFAGTKFIQNRKNWWDRGSTLYTFCQNVETNRTITSIINDTQLGAYLKNISNAEKIIGNGPTYYVKLINGQISKINEIGISRPTDIPSNITGIADYGQGNNFSIGLFENGYVTGWGSGKYIHGFSQDGCGAPVSNNAYLNQGQLIIPPSIQGKVKEISVGLNHTVALLNDGFFTGWGYETMRTLSVECNRYIDYTYNPFSIRFPSSISGQVKKAIAGNNYTKVLLKNGTMTGFGHGFTTGKYGQGGNYNWTTIGDYNISKFRYLNEKYSGYIDNFDDNDNYVIRSGSLLFFTGQNIFSLVSAQGSLKLETIINIPQYTYIKQYGDTQFSLNITSNDPSPIQYTVANKNIASCNQDGLVTINNSGTTYISVTQPGNAYYHGIYPAKDITLIIKGKSNQVINFPNLPVKNLVDDYIFPLASANSNLPITYTGYDSNIVEISNLGIAKIKNTGTTTITAMQTGNVFYHPAQDVSRNLTVIPSKTNQELNLDLEIQAKYNDPILFLPSRSNREFNINYTINPSYVGEIVNTSGIKYNSTGYALITATQTGNDYYYAVEKNINLTVSKADQTITFPPIPSQKFRKSIFYITGSSDSNLNLNYFISNTGIAKIVNQSGILMLKTGIFQITGTQSGNDVYESGASIVRNFTILKGDQKIKL